MIILLSCKLTPSVNAGSVTMSIASETIIAGSNNERMVALRCPACGKVALYTKEDYEIAKKKGELYCFSDRNAVLQVDALCKCRVGDDEYRVGFLQKLLDVLILFLSRAYDTWTVERRQDILAGGYE